MGKNKPWVSALLGIFAQPRSRAISDAAAMVPDDGGDEDFVFGAVSLDGGEESAPSLQAPRAAASPLPPAVANHSASAPHDSLRARLLREWREQLILAAGAPPV